MIGVAILVSIINIEVGRSILLFVKMGEDMKHPKPSTKNLLTTTGNLTSNNRKNIVNQLMRVMNK